MFLMACAPHPYAVDNMLGFLRFKQVIDSDNRVLNAQQARFYLERAFNPQLIREKIPGDAFTISKGILIPNYDALDKLDRFAGQEGEVVVAEASYTHYAEAIDRTSTWQETMRAKLDDYGFSPEEQHYIQQMAEAGMIPLSCK